jgi:hypothetical protein
MRSQEQEVASKPEDADGKSPSDQGTEPVLQAVPPLCWPFPPGSQNQTDKAVRLRPYTPPKRRSLNQF